MATTKTQTISIADVLNEANLNRLIEALRKTKLGNMLTPRKVTFAALSAAAAHDITDAAHFAAATVAPAYPTTGPSARVTLPPILSVIALRVSAGGTSGPYIVSDTGATAVTTTATYPGTAKLSDDGKTITFLEATVTGFVLEYIPRADVDLTQAFEQ